MSTTAVAGSRGLERWIRERVAESAGVAASSVSLNMPLSRLGVDSLGMLHLLETVERELGKSIPTTMCFESVTVRSLTQTLIECPRSKTLASTTLAARMAADSELPDDIRPQGTWGLPGSPGPPPRPLLTGGTGFLGAFLLRSLLRNTDAQVALLVRPGQIDGHARVRRNLEHYGVWEDRFEDRIIIFNGDLSQPRLGLGPSTFEGLANSVDVLFHAAASVNWIHPYERLRNPNVLAVRELLRLACRSKAKPFCFISSLATCYSSTANTPIAETDDTAADLHGLHLGYAQTKCVAESLVRAAAARGLPVAIFRPALISGDSVTGTSNTADLVSSLIKGCIHMHAAPDLDWKLDLLPADFAAEAIVRLALSPSQESFKAFHLANPHPRHWRELILWMNLFGYPIDLIPYDDWLHRLAIDCRTGTANPLRDLLPFFAHRPQNERGLYLPQLYEEPRRRKVRFAMTRDTLGAVKLPCPRLSTALLDRYFDSFIDQEFIPRVQTRPLRGHRAPELNAQFFASLLEAPVTSVTRIEFSGGHSVIGELTSWKYGSTIGVRAYRLAFAEAGRELDVVVKVKACDTEIKDVGQTLAGLCSPQLGKAYDLYFDYLGFSGCHTRELEIYRQTDETFRRFTPAYYGGRSDDGRVTLVLEKLSAIEMMDAVDDIDEWRPEYIETAIAGIAELHAIALGSPPDRTRISGATDLWMTLAAHARLMFEKWIGPEIAAIQQTLIDRLDDVQSIKSRMPHTRIHNDFNPRNFAFRRTNGELRLCVYDWELATTGLPQHDLAELLCFVLPPDVSTADPVRYIEMHRQALERASGRQMDRESWKLGFLLSLEDLMLNRLPAYAMVHRFQEQRFLERVVQTWKGLFDVVSGAIHPIF